jgi:hypothetical protein
MIDQSGIQAQICIPVHISQGLGGGAVEATTQPSCLFKPVATTNFSKAPTTVSLTLDVTAKQCL